MAHILSGCKIALIQGRYRWRHNKVLAVLADILEQERRKKTTSQSKTTAEHHHLCERGPKTYCPQPSQAESLAVSQGMGNGG